MDQLDGSFFEAKKLNRGIHSQIDIQSASIYSRSIIYFHIFMTFESALIEFDQSIFHLNHNSSTVHSNNFSSSVGRRHESASPVTFHVPLSLCKTKSSTPT